MVSLAVLPVKYLILTEAFPENLQLFENVPLIMLVIYIAI